METFSIQVVKGATTEIISIDVTNEMTVLEFKRKIQEQMDINPEQVTLVYASSQLEPDEEKLSFFDIKPDSTVYIVVRLKGGV